jgi:hypothetical protein
MPLYLKNCSMQLSSNEASFQAERLYVHKLNMILVQVWLSLSMVIP